MRLPSCVFIMHPSFLRLSLICVVVMLNEDVYVYNICMCVCMCVCTNSHTHTHTHIYIYIYVERERGGGREREKARWKLYKNATSFMSKSWKQHPTPPKKQNRCTPVYFPSQKPSRMANNTCGTQLEKQGQTHMWRSSIDPWHMYVSLLADQQEIIYISSLRTQDVV